MRVTKALFPELMAKGALCSTALLSMRFLPADTSPSRFSVTVSKKVAKLAVDRNRIRRRVSAALAPLTPTFSKTNFYIGVISAKSGIEKASFPQIRTELAELLKKARIA